MKKGMKILFTVVMFTTLISFGKEAEKREEQPQLTVEMLMAALDVSYRCYDIEDVVGSEKSLYLEVVTKDGVILSRLITMLKQLQPDFSCVVKKTSFVFRVSFWWETKQVWPVVPCILKLMIICMT